MIEALVASIEDKGYKVQVFPMRLYLYKRVAGDDWECGYFWAISQWELTHVPSKEFLLREADRHMREIDQAIAKRQTATT